MSTKIKRSILKTLTSNVHISFLPKTNLSGAVDDAEEERNDKVLSLLVMCSRHSHISLIVLTSWIRGHQVRSQTLGTTRIILVWTFHVRWVRSRETTRCLKEPYTSILAVLNYLFISVYRPFLYNLYFWYTFNFGTKPKPKLQGHCYEFILSLRSSSRYV